MQSLSINLAVRTLLGNMVSANPESTANATFVLAIIRSRKRFEALRNFTLETAQEDIQRQRQRKKDSSPSRASSGSLGRSPINPHPRTSLQDVPEESGAFAIGEDDDSEDDKAKPRVTRVSTPSHSPRTPSISSSVDDAVPVQVRGMSEKARGKMPAGAPTFSRQNSTTSLGHTAAAMTTSDAGFAPSEHWVR